jgi:hypothetical protein
MADTNAVQGASAVADAVKRIADEAVNAIKKVPGEPVPDMIVDATSNGGFTIRGKGFSTNGTVTFDGQQAKTTGWGDTHIEGIVPAGVKSGEVVVHVDDRTTRKGTFKIL